MKDIFEGNPAVSVKRKHVQTIFDHCLEKKIEFTVKPGIGNDEWLIEFQITNVKKAVLLGMFLRENKLDLNDISYKSTKNEKPASEPAPAVEKAAVVATEQTNGANKKQEIKEVTLDDFAPSFSFGEEDNTSAN
jgi:hypothetical protein